MQHVERRETAKIKRLHELGNILVLLGFRFKVSVEKLRDIVIILLIITCNASKARATGLLRINFLQMLEVVRTELRYNTLA